MNHEALLRKVRDELDYKQLRYALKAYTRAWSEHMSIWERDPLTGGERLPIIDEHVAEGRFPSFLQFKQDYDRKTSFNLKPPPKKLMPLGDVLLLQARTVLAAKLLDFAERRETAAVTRREEERRLKHELEELEELNALSDMGIEKSAWS